MSIGLNPSKAEIDNTIGNLTRRIQADFDAITNLKYYFDSTIDADLVAKGYIQAEVNSVKSAFTDLAQLNTIYTGAANLASAKDFRAFVKLLRGMGNV